MTPPRLVTTPHVRDPGPAFVDYNKRTVSLAAFNWLNAMGWDLDVRHDPETGQEELADWLIETLDRQITEEELAARIATRLVPFDTSESCSPEP